MALFTAVLIAVVIKSAYLSIPWVDLSSGTSPELSAASRVDSKLLGRFGKFIPNRVNVDVPMRLCIYCNFDGEVITAQVVTY